MLITFLLQAWLESHNRKLGHFINNKWVHPEGRKVYVTKAPATGETLATTVQGEEEDVELAVGAARKAYDSWSKMPGHVRARHLYRLVFGLCEFTSKVLI